VKTRDRWRMPGTAALPPDQRRITAHCGHSHGCAHASSPLWFTRHDPPLRGLLHLRGRGQHRSRWRLPGTKLAFGSWGWLPFGKPVSGRARPGHADCGRL